MGLKRLCLRVWVGVFLLSPAFLAAQTYPFQVYGLQDGLPQSQVICLAQDPEGYIWVGTWGGLTRFNGDRFTPFFVKDGLPSSHIQRMLVDRSGVLWVATEAGLANWQSHRLSAINDPAVAGLRCRALVEDRQGGLWVGTDRGLVLLREGRFSPVVDRTGESLGMIYDLIAEKSGIAGISVSGLFRVEAGQPVEKIPGPETNPGILRSLCRTRDGLWVGTSEQGLFVRRSDHWEPVPASEVEARNIPWLGLGRSGTLYVATRGAGLYRRPPGQAAFEALSSHNGLPSRLINCAFEDKRGNLWVGTDIGGLARLRSGSVLNYGRSDGLPSNCVFGISPAATPGEAWFATLGGGARCRITGSMRVLETVGVQDGLSGNHIWKIVATPRGEVWAMGDTSFHYRPAGQKRFERPPRDVPIPRQEIYGLTQDSRGRVWLCGADHESSLAVRDEKGAWRSWNHSAEGKTVFHCRIIAPRAAGGVWVGADGRVLFSDGLTLHEMEDPLPGTLRTSIDGLCEDRQSRLWAARDGGLLVHEPGSGWQAIKTKSDYNFSQVYFMNEDQEGTIWVGVSNGVLRVTRSGRIEPFTLEDGLAGLETNQDGFYAAPDGSIWIGTVDGVSRIDLAGLSRPVPAPPLIVEAAELPGRVVQYPRSLDLSWQDRSVTFRVAVLGYCCRGEPAYEARLQGMEDEWIESRRGGGLRYTNITPGSYNLQLRAAAPSGGWGPMQSLPLVVRTPFWVSWWFRAAVLAAAVFIALGVFFWRTRVLRARAQELERIVAERTEELVAANQELERLATHDPLTGLWNRRAILDHLGALLQESKRTAGSYSFGLIIVDIDDFKRVNDRLGHVAGDLVLRDVARQIEQQTRQVDSVGRYGGDEFLVILRGADRAAVESVARRIAQAAYTTQVENGSATVTASCGALAVEGKVHPTETSVLSQSDELLYRAKSSGKHQYLIANAGAGKPGRG
jgi:diguanylate cyclase (GGDEF)-like protein